MLGKGTAAALILFSTCSLTGCNTGVHATTTAASALPPALPQHGENRYVMHGSPDKVALLVDSETGTVWRYDGSKFVAVPKEPVENWVRGADGRLHKEQ